MTKPKILWISNYREQTGYSEAARRIIQAVNIHGNIVTRNIKLTNTKHDQKCPVIEKTESKYEFGSNIAIHCTLPHLVKPVRDCLNYCWFFLDSQLEPTHPWINKLNLLDGVIVSKIDSIESLNRSGVKVPLYYFPVPCDPEKYKKQYEKLDLGPDYKFYFIGEFGIRKRIPAIIMAFHLAFRTIPSQLIIKTNGNINEILKIIDQVKKGMKLSWYNNTETIITDRFDENKICALHQSCDCYVNYSYGEGFDLPSFDAFAFGNKVISSNNNFTEYHIPENMDHCYGAVDSNQEVCTSYEMWNNPTIHQLVSAMKSSYISPGERFYKYKTSTKEKNNLDNWSFDKVGKDIVTLFEGILS